MQTLINLIAGISFLGLVFIVILARKLFKQDIEVLNHKNYDEETDWLLSMD